MIPDFGPFFEAVKYLAFGSILLWPLGLWKFIEIVIWLVRHVHFS